MPEFEIRPAEACDLRAIVEIYNHYVRSTPVTFDLEAFTPDARRSWFEQFAPVGPHRLLVAEREGAVAGYASSSRHRAKAAYDSTVETTIYLDEAHLGLGVGRLLYGALLGLLEAETPVHRAVAGITLPNAGSVALHTRLGFSAIGVFREVGFKFGRYWDVAWFERGLSGPVAR